MYRRSDVGDCMGPAKKHLAGFHLCIGRPVLTRRTAAREKIEELLFFQLPQLFFPLLPRLLVREPAKAEPALRWLMRPEARRSKRIT